MTRKQIEARIQALDMYELSCHRNVWDDADRVSDELTKILVAKSRLRIMLKEARD